MNIPPDGEDLGGEQRFSDLVDNLDFAAQLHVEAQKGGLGFMLDLTNLQLSDRVRQGNVEVDTDSSTTLVEGATLVRLSGSESPTELLLGFRLLTLDLDLEIEAIDPVPVSRGREVSMDVTVVDAMLGLRHTQRISDRWSFVLRGDVAAGGTDLSWNAAALLGRNIGSRGRLVFGYRYLKAELESKKEFVDPELTVKGPEIGYSFLF